MKSGPIAAPTARELVMIPSSRTAVPWVAREVAFVPVDFIAIKTVFAHRNVNVSEKSLELENQKILILFF